MIRPSNRASIRNISDYSPFGVQLAERTISGDGYRYGFNGMEGDDEIKGAGNSYDFGARMLEPRLGRWLSLDAKAKSYPSISPYVFVNNMPIWAIDPDGNDIIILSAPSGANGMGHGAILIGNDTDGWKFYSKNGVGEHTSGNSKGSKGASVIANLGDNFANLKDFANSENNFHDGEVYYTSAFRITSSKSVDKKMTTAALKQVKKDYDLTDASCIDVCSDALTVGGFDPGRKATNTSGGVTIPDIPNVRFAEITDNNKGIFVTEIIKPSTEVVNLEKEAHQNVYDVNDAGVKYHTPDSDNTRVYNPIKTLNLDKSDKKKDAKTKLKEIRGNTGG